MRIFIGIDPRSPVSYNVLQWSIIRRASKPVQIIPLVLPQLPISKRGLTDFTFSRYLPPFLCNYRGISVFMDSDMLVLGDVHELGKLVDGNHEVYVAKHQQRFEWPSLMVFDNALCQKLTPEYIDDENTKPSTFEWAENVGDIPQEWNFCVGYEEKAPAKLVHFTQGVPHFAEVRGCDYAEEWQEEFKSMNASCSWIELMGKSVHAEGVLKKLGVM
jgi:hypothetical protein